MSALMLRSIAAVCMLLDHVGYCLHIPLLRYVGRLAFPLYVFLMVNGFRHTRDPLRYALRFAVFAVLSQIPFSLMCYGRPFHPKLNVMVTLLLGLLAIWFGDVLRKRYSPRCLCLLPSLLMYTAYCIGFIDSDYGGKGILLATVFWLFEGKKPWIVIGAFLAIFNQSIAGAALDLLRGDVLTAPGHWEQLQLLSLLSLPLIFLYNGKPGQLPQHPMEKKAVQLGFYAFYPVHMLLLWLLCP